MKVKKIIILALGCILMCGCFSGCTATSEDKESKIDVDLASGVFVTTNVTFWDSEERIVYTSDGKCKASSRLQFNKTSIEFTDENGDLREMSMDKKLMNKPEKIKIYIDENKKEYECYSVTY